VVRAGPAGARPGVIGAVEAALRAQELIKVHVEKPGDKKATVAALAQATGAGLCRRIGHTAILYRPRAEKPRIRV
jgi:RNA-binding protein YhbY